MAMNLSSMSYIPGNCSMTKIGIILKIEKNFTSIDYFKDILKNTLVKEPR